MDSNKVTPSFVERLLPPELADDATVALEDFVELRNGIGKPIKRRSLIAFAFYSQAIASYQFYRSFDYLMAMFGGTRVVPEADILHETIPPTMKITGWVKQFDPVTGFGFVRPDGHIFCVLLHITSLHRSGVRTIFRGARVEVEVANSPIGYKCDRLLMHCYRFLSVDYSCAIHTPDSLPFGIGPSDWPHRGWELAVVESFDRRIGFGRLRLVEGKRKVFVHMGVLRRCGIPEMLVGQRFLICYCGGLKARIATEAQLVA